jgi:hypothetical protein
MIYENRRVVLKVICVIWTVLCFGEDSFPFSYNSSCQSWLIWLRPQSLMKENRKVLHQIWNWKSGIVLRRERKLPCFWFLATMLRTLKLTCHTTSLCWMVWLWPAFSNSCLVLPAHIHYMRCSVCLLPNASRPKAESENKRRHIWAIPLRT